MSVECRKLLVLVETKLKYKKVENRLKRLYKRQKGDMFEYLRKNKRSMGHIAHLRKQFKSINTYDYHNIDKEKKKPIIYFMRIDWFFI